MIDQILAAIQEVRRMVMELPDRIRVAAKQIQVTSLSEISDNLGTIAAGEFRSGNQAQPGRGFSGLRIGYPALEYAGKRWNLVLVEEDNLRIGLSAEGTELRLGNGQEPGLGFSGVRMAYPAIEYGGQWWNFVGVDEDTLQFGLSSTNGKAMAGAGNVTLDADGISFTPGTGRRNRIKWWNGFEDAVRMGQDAIGACYFRTDLFDTNNITYMVTADTEKQLGYIGMYLRDGASTHEPIRPTVHLSVVGEGGTGTVNVHMFGTYFSGPLMLKQTDDTIPTNLRASYTTAGLLQYKTDNKLYFIDKNGVETCLTP
jgi:hypothetical protein